jgi:hypothetical protein
MDRGVKYGHEKGMGQEIGGEDGGRKYQIA